MLSVNIILVLIIFMIIFSFFVLLYKKKLEKINRLESEMRQLGAVHEQSNGEIDRLKNELVINESLKILNVQELNSLTIKFKNLEETIEDPTNIYCNYLKKILDSLHKIQMQVNDAVIHVEFKIKGLKENEISLCREPSLRSELIFLLEHARNKFEQHSNIINQSEIFVRTLNMQTKTLKVELAAPRQDIEKLEELNVYIQSLCKPFTRDEQWIRRIGQLDQDKDLAIDGRIAAAKIAAEDAKNSKLDFERWKYTRLTPRDKFEQIRKAWGQRDNYG